MQCTKSRDHVMQQLVVENFLKFSNTRLGGKLNGKTTYWPADQNKIPDVVDDNCQITTVAELSSDHVPILLDFESYPLLKMPPTSLVNRYTDWELFRSHIDAVLHHHIAIAILEDLDNEVLNITWELQETARSCTPKLQKSKIHPISLASSALCKLCRNARKRWQQVRSPSSHRKYCQLNNVVCTELRDSRNASFRLFLSGLSPHPDSNYSLWKATRKF